MSRIMKTEAGVRLRQATTLLDISRNEKRPDNNFFLRADDGDNFCLSKTGWTRSFLSKSFFIGPASKFCLVEAKSIPSQKLRYALLVYYA